MLDRGADTGLAVAQATKIHFVLGLAWYLRVVTPKQLVSLYHSMYTDDYR